MTCSLAKRPFSLGVVILAAGRSARMGRPKLLLPWGRTSVIGHLIRQWQDLRAAQIVVVCAPADRLLQAELNRLRFPAQPRILNPAPQRGMFSSVLCAARWPGWRPILTHWAIILGDQPHLRLPTLRRLLHFSAAHPAKVCQPAWRDHPRHPVLLPKPLFRRLARSRAATLKGFLAARPRSLARCELDDPGLDLDLDHPEDYAHALLLQEGQAHAKPEI